MLTQQARYQDYEPEQKRSDAFHLAPYFLARVTGLPFTILDQLRFSETTALVEEIIALEEWLDKHHDAVIETLRQHYEQCSEQQVRHANLDMRRAIAQLNGSKARKYLPTLALSLMETRKKELEEWCDKAVRRMELLERGDLTLQQELVHCRQVLRDLLHDDNFQHGLLLSSSILYTELQHYLNTPPEKSNNRLRRTEDGLLAYLVRMVSKTSPYSTFTSTSLGFWREQASQPVQMDIQNRKQKRFVRFHAGLLQTMIHLLEQHPVIRPHLKLTLNTTLQWIEPPSSVPSVPKLEVFIQKKEGTAKYNRYQEAVLRLRLDPLKQVIIQIIQDARGTLTYQETMDKVVAYFDALATEDATKSGEAHHAYSSQDVQAVIEALAQRSVLSISLHIPVHEDKKLTAIVNVLEHIPGEEVSVLREAFQQLAILLEAYATTPAAESFRLLNTIRQQTLALGHLLATTQKASMSIADEVEKVFPNLILEDTTLEGQEMTLHRPALQHVLEDVYTVQSIAPLVDMDTMIKMVSHRIGQEALRSANLQQEDMLQHHMRLSREYSYRQLPQKNWEEFCPELLQLMQQRTAFVQWIGEQVQSAMDKGMHTLVLDPQQIQQRVQHFPPFLRQRYSLSHFLQLFQEEGQYQAVLNTAWPGAGVAFSRFSHMFQSESGSFSALAQEYIAQLGKVHGSTYASIAETGDINVNIHAPLTPYEILFSHNASLHTQEKNILLRDLYVTWNSTSQEIELRSKRLGTRVSPLHLGFSVPEMLPPLYQALMTASSHYPSFNMVALVENHLSAEQKAAEVRHYPRIACGHVVLNRECWKISGSSLPRPVAGESAFEYFLKVNRWRTSLGLPIEGFRRAYSNSEHQIQLQDEYLNTLFGKQESTTDSTPTQQELVPQLDERKEAMTESSSPQKQRDHHALSDNVRKPFYLDFRNYFLVHLFGNALKDISQEYSLTFEELLPAHEHHLVRHENESYPAEFVIELG